MKKIMTISALILFPCFVNAKCPNLGSDEILGIIYNPLGGYAEKIAATEFERLDESERKNSGYSAVGLDCGDGVGRIGLAVYDLPTQPVRHAILDRVGQFSEPEFLGINKKNDKCEYSFPLKNSPNDNVKLSIDQIHDNNCKFNITPWNSQKKGSATFPSDLYMANEFDYGM